MAGGQTGAQLPGCIPTTVAEGFGIDAEQICFDAGPSPLWRTITYKLSDGALTSVKFYNDIGTEVVPAGTEIPCGSGAAANVNIIGPIGPGSCASAVRVTQCEPVSVIIDTSAGESLRPQVSQISGLAGLWALGVDTTGRVKSVTVVCNNDGVPGGTGAGSGVALTDDAGSISMFSNNSLTWGVEAGDDQVTGTLSVATSDAQAVVTIAWTEVI